MKSDQVFRRLEFSRAFLLQMLAVCFLQIAVVGQDDVIRVNTDLIGFEVIVTDKKGIPIRGLKAEDFVVLEDGVKREIDFFEPLRKKNESNRPLSIVFALDVSGSITIDELSNLRLAMQSFIRRLADYDSYFAVTTFGMEVKTIQGFTNKPEKLEKTFSRLSKEIEGLSTHAYDAADDAIRLLRKKAPQTAKNKPMKRAVILITDGFPVGDTVTPETVIERANNSETSIYTVILPSYSRLQGNKSPLPTPLEISGLAERTGGSSFYANQRDYEPLFKALAEDITASYSLAFYPPEEAKKNGKYYEVKIKVANDLVVKQNRSGYQLKGQ